MILKEYIKFSKILDANNKKYGYTKKSINETIKYCIEHNFGKWVNPSWFKGAQPIAVTEEPKNSN